MCLAQVAHANIIDTTTMRLVGIVQTQGEYDNNLGLGTWSGAPLSPENQPTPKQDLIRSPKTGPFRVRVFRVIFPWLGGVEDDESIEVFGRPKGVHSPAGR
jgi:hypothetical protein